MPSGLSESLFPGDFLLGLDSPVAPDMEHAGAPLAEHAADQPPPMTVGRIFFSAQKRRTTVPDGLQEPLQAAREGRRPSQTVVEDVSLVVVEILPLRFAPQKIAEEQVVDAATLQGATDCLPVEIRRVARVGTRTDVHHQPDPVLLDQREERLQRMVGMPDREDGDFLAHTARPSSLLDGRASLNRSRRPPKRGRGRRDRVKTTYEMHTLLEWPQRRIGLPERIRHPHSR